jgi:hypothetical protein
VGGPMGVAWEAPVSPRAPQVVNRVLTTAAEWLNSSTTLNGLPTCSRAAPATPCGRTPGGRAAMLEGAMSIKQGVTKTMEGLSITRWLPTSSYRVREVVTGPRGKVVGSRAENAAVCTSGEDWGWVLEADVRHTCKAAELRKGVVILKVAGSHYTYGPRDGLHPVCQLQ